MGWDVTQQKGGTVELRIVISCMSCGRCLLCEEKITIKLKNNRIYNLWSVVHLFLEKMGGVQYNCHYITVVVTPRLLRSSHAMHFVLYLFNKICL